jgi:UDP-glucose 4-epimerase
MLDRVLIFGGTGFIGSHLVRVLERKGYTVATASRSLAAGRSLHFKGDMIEQGFIEHCLAEFKPNIILNLASAVRPGRDPKDFEQQMDETILPSVRLAQLVSPEVRLTIFCGSCEEYGNGPTPFLEDGPTTILSPYGWGKVATKSAVEWICRERAVKYTWIRPFLTFGPEQKTQLLIPHLINGCLDGKSMDLTMGEQTRDFMYVLDVCNMISMILSSPEEAANETFNICSETPRMIRDVAAAIQRKIGYGALNFGKIPYRSNEAMSFFGSSEKFDRTFGKFHMTNFEAALDATINWYAQKHANPKTTPVLNHRRLDSENAHGL